jgi:hypothetical protein
MRKKHRYEFCRLNEKGRLHGELGRPIARISEQVHLIADPVGDVLGEGEGGLPIAVLESSCEGVF